jgi:hypothetical protein
MKVTVCFGDTKVIVPCGDGDVTVSQVIANAVQRYKKATQRGNECRLSVAKLKTQRDGGILDPDDIMRDVVEDKEILIAVYGNEPYACETNDTDFGSKDSLNNVFNRHNHEVYISENDFHTGKHPPTSASRPHFDFFTSE